MTKHSGGLFRDERDDQRFVDDDMQWTWGVGHHDFGDHNHDGHHDHGQHVLHVGADEQFITIQSAVDAAQNGDLNSD